MDPSRPSRPQAQAAPPAPPLPQPTTTTLNAIRQTYMNLFNHILDSSININCICKTTTLRGFRSPSTSRLYKKFKHNKSGSSHKTIFEGGNFLSDEEEEESDEGMSVDSGTGSSSKDTDDSNSTVDLGSAFAYSNEMGSFLRDSDYDEFGVNKQNMCDLSCFEKMRFVHAKLKESVLAANAAVVTTKKSTATSLFDRLWAAFKFLSKHPTSCDYYGTTIFHYAALDDNPELLMRCLEKYPDGVKCIDSKGMTPLMRAVQRNNMPTVRYLLNHTESDLNGSTQSTYTPLWFAVSNGYNDLALMLLNFNASSSMVEKCISSAIPLPTSVANTLLRTEDLSGGIAASRAADQNTTTVSSTSYLFSPLRASIVYSRFQIMTYLLEFNASVYELFNVGPVTCGGSGDKGKFKLPKPGPTLDLRLNDDYVSSLKFFHRQFSLDEVQNTAAATSLSTTTVLGQAPVDLDLQLSILNEFIDDVNVYRRMLIEFVKSLVHRLYSNLNLIDRLYDFLTTQSKGSIIEYIMKMNETVCRNDDEEEELEKIEWTDYVSAVSEFIDLLERFIALTPENAFNFNLHTNNSLIRKPNYNKSMFDFAVRLFDRFHRPKSLKQLARFKIREMLFERVDNRQNKVKYTDECLKRDRLETIVKQFGLPTDLANYILFKA